MKPLSLAAHFVAGVLDQKSVVSAIASLAGKADFQPGDRIKTLKGSVRGKIVRVLEDGRVVWRADDPCGTDGSAGKLDSRKETVTLDSLP